MEFAFGGNSGMTYDQLQRKRKIADAMLAQNMATPKNVSEGLSAVARAIMSNKINKKADAREGELRTDFNAQIAGLLGGIGGGGTGGGSSYGGGTPGGTWTPAAPPPKPTDVAPGMGVTPLTLNQPPMPKEGSGEIGFGSSTMTPQEMIIAGAKARGLDPIDVATAISYETGGTFDPLQKGPTTQWGQHEGLIQFGDPQGDQYGAVFDQGADAAMRSQLDPGKGAVWGYLDGSGVQPGMGLDNIYSAINAGAPGRFNASDANNGGAPGTVADKVAGMGDHRTKAAAFLGGTWTPNEGGGAGSAVSMSAQNAPQGGVDLAQIISLMDSPLASPGQKAVLSAMLQRQMDASAPKPPVNPMDAIELQKAQLELAQMQNPQANPMADIELQQAQLNLDQDQAGGGAEVPKTLTERNALWAETKLPIGTQEHNNYLLTGELTAPGGGTEYGLQMVLGRDKDGKPVVMQLGKDGTAVQTEMPDGITPDIGLLEAEKAAGTAEGKALGEDTALLASMSSKLPGLETVVSELEGLADKATYTLAGQAKNYIGAQLGFEPQEAAISRAEYVAKVDNQVLPMLRDTFGAAFTVKEGETLRATLGDPNKTPAEKKAVLRAFIEQAKRNVEGLTTRTGAAPSGTKAGGETLTYNPETGDFE